jgi:gamma-glutamyltranspeptidase/glutathione hydrolase
MPTIYPLVMGREAVVSTEHYLSASAGAQIFARGGNAIDAAVAAAFVEGIVNPHMHTIGGEAPMLIYSADARRVVAINGNMTAPARATIEHFRSLGIKLIPAAGLLAAGVPAALGAFLTALGEFGTMSLAHVVEPALALAEDGFPVHVGLCGEAASGAEAHQAGAGAALGFYAERFRTKWPSSARVYLPGGKLPSPGTILRNPALGKFFRRLLDAESGAKSRGRAAALEAARERFYRGDIASDMVAWSDAQGGLLASQDFERFTTRIEEPLSVDYRGVTVFKCGPWSQGPVFLQQLRMLEAFDLRAMGHNSPDYIHTVIESAKLAFADREAWYADPEFTRVPIDGLISAKYAAIRRALIDPRHASHELRPGDPIAMRPRLEGPAPASRPWGGGTVHVTAADRKGNLIAITDADLLSRREPSQRARARKAPSHHAHAVARDARRRAVPGLRHAGRRSAGSMDFPVLPEPGRVRDESAGGNRGAKIFHAALSLHVLSAQLDAGSAASGGSRRSEHA